MGTLTSGIDGDEGAIVRALRKRRRRRPGDRRLSYALAVAVLAGLLLIGFGAANLVGDAQSGWSVVGLGTLIVAAGTLLLVVEPPLNRPVGKRSGT